MIYYFASVNENSFVDSVHIISDEFCTDENGLLNEDMAINYLNNFHGKSKWIRTERDGSIRYNYAGIGYYYYEEYDAFVPPRPSESSILTDNFTWIDLDLAQMMDSFEID